MSNFSTRILVKIKDWYIVRLGIIHVNMPSANFITLHSSLAQQITAFFFEKRSDSSQKLLVSLGISYKDIEKKPLVYPFYTCLLSLQLVSLTTTCMSGVLFHEMNFELI